MSDSTSSPYPPLGGRPSLEPERKAGGMRRDLRGPDGGWLGVFPTKGTLWLLLVLLTGVGAYLRFWRLGQQSYWCDEASTAERICDTWDHLMMSLSTQAFPPGWYVGLWHWLHFTQWLTSSTAQGFMPDTLRILPAIFGTLTVPAMYLLARQFTDRRGALLVMLLAAVNPYLIYYSRDVKMYAALWFFVTLHVALFFMWLSVRPWKVRHFLIWPAFALSGMAMLSLHDTAWFIVGLELIWLLTKPKLKSMDGPLWALAVGMMAALPIWWHLHKSSFLNRATLLAEGQPTGYRRGDDLGLGWNLRYTDMSWHTIMGLPTSHLFGFLWPEEPVSERMKDWFDLGDTFSQIPWLATLEWYAGVSLLVVLFAGLLPWRIFGWSFGMWGERVLRGHWAWKLAVLFPPLPGFYWVGFRRSPERLLQATDGRSWWVGLWIVLPVAAVAATWLDDKTSWHIPFTHWTLTHDEVWHSLHLPKVWEPRYLGFVAPAFLLWLAASLRRLPMWPVRLAATVGVLGVCLASALTNQLTYRQAPFQQTAAAVESFIDKKHPETLAFGVPWVEFAANSAEYPFVLALGGTIEPQGNANGLEHVAAYDKFMPVDASYHLTDGRNGSYTTFLQLKASNPRIQTIVLTDRLAGTAHDTISDAAALKILEARGDTWELKTEEENNWHYEWRFYVYHTWRTRVWVRVTPSKAR